MTIQTNARFDSDQEGLSPPPAFLQTPSWAVCWWRPSQRGTFACLKRKKMVSSRQLILLWFQSSYSHTVVELGEAIIFVPDNCFPFSRRTLVSSSLQVGSVSDICRCASCRGENGSALAPKAADGGRFERFCERDYVAAGEAGDWRNLFRAFFFT